MLDPKHPQLLLDAPHAFFSPYTVMVALLARTLHLDAVAALSIMGLVNLGLLLLGLKLFVCSIVPKNRNATAFYALLLTLFWWGSNAWPYSGFFHVGVLGYVLPYPSTFAAAITLIALAANQLRTETRRQIWLVPIFLIAVAVLISHPITFLFLAVGLVSQSFGETGSVLSQIVVVGSLFSLAFLAATFWPYFPVLKLFMGESGVYNPSNRIMYQHVFSRMWPSLIGLPLVIASMRSNCRSPLVLMLGILSVIYIFGAVSGKYSYGRVVSYIVLLLHISIAEHLSMLESRVPEIRASIWLHRLIVPASVIVLALFLCWTPLKITLLNALLEQPPIYKPYLFLSQSTSQGDVVLSDPESSLIVPTFGGRVVAVIHPLAFVPDQDIRSSDLDRFFNAETASTERQKIIQKYEANHSLLRKDESVNWEDLLQSFMQQGQIEYESDNFVLIDLKPNPEKVIFPGQ